MNREIIPKEVAGAIENLRKEEMNNYAIMACAQHANSDEDLLVIKDWAFECEAYGGNTDKLMRALVNGYEIEKTPEEKVQEYYLSVKGLAERSKDTNTKAEHESELLGIKTTLDKLGIVIEGVNV